ncbi:MAG: DUF4328 domain-containing protein [Janthinobacterium lividum]
MAPLTQPLRDNHRRAATALITLVLFMLSAIGWAGTTVGEGLVWIIWPNWPVVEERIDYRLHQAYNQFCDALLWTHLLLLVGSAGLFIAWLRRAYYNLHQLPAIRCRYATGWAAGAWWVPGLNLVLPYLLVRDVWQQTQGAGLRRQARPATLVGWWWAACLLKLAVTVFVKTGMEAGVSYDIFEHSLLVAATILAHLPAAALTWRLIGQCAEFEEALAWRAHLDSLGQPAMFAPATQQPDYSLADDH